MRLPAGRSISNAADYSCLGQAPRQMLALRFAAIDGKRQPIELWHGRVWAAQEEFRSPERRCEDPTRGEGCGRIVAERSNQSRNESVALWLGSSSPAAPTAWDVPLRRRSS